MVLYQTLKIEIIRNDLLSFQLGGFMLPIVGLVVVVIVYLALPAWLEVVLFLINLFVPDPIPYLDEILMILPIIAKIKRKNKV